MTTPTPAIRKTLLAMITRMRSVVSSGRFECLHAGDSVAIAADDGTVVIFVAPRKS